MVKITRKFRGDEKLRFERKVLFDSPLFRARSTLVRLEQELPITASILGALDIDAADGCCPHQEEKSHIEPSQTEFLGHRKICTRGSVFVVRGRMDPVKPRTTIGLGFNVDLV